MTKGTCRARLRPENPREPTGQVLTMRLQPLLRRATHRSAPWFSGRLAGPRCRANHVALPAPRRPGPARSHRGIGGLPLPVASHLNRGADTIFRDRSRRGPARGVTAVGTRGKTIERGQGRGDPYGSVSIRPAPGFCRTLAGGLLQIWMGVLVEMTGGCPEILRTITAPISKWAPCSPTSRRVLRYETGSDPGGSILRSRRRPGAIEGVDFP